MLFICKVIVLTVSSEAYTLSQSVVIYKNTLVGTVIITSSVTTLLIALNPKINQSLSLSLTLTIFIVQ